MRTKCSRSTLSSSASLVNFQLDLLVRTRIVPSDVIAQVKSMPWALSAEVLIALQKSSLLVFLFFFLSFLTDFPFFYLTGHEKPDCDEKTLLFGKTFLPFIEDLNAV